MRTRKWALIALLASAGVARAQLNIPSDGSDGALVINGETTIDLSQAVTGTWNQPSPNPGKGVYDPNLWAVVYKYSSVATSPNNIYFKPHPSGAPVVWLVDGNVTIQGILHLEGGNQNGIAQSVPGPGGFRGGAGFSVLGASAGFGPGGGNLGPNYNNTGAGSYATAGSSISGLLYGNQKIVPLIGGSGGAGRGDYPEGGGAGGGAILIAAKNSISFLSYGIYAYGGIGQNGFGGGSGGAIRLIADSVNVAAGATLTASAQSGGGLGRIRIEANTRTINGTVIPTPSVVTPPQTPQIWPDSTTPKLQIVQIGASTVTADPRANLFQPDVEFTSGGSKTVLVQATNVPVDGSWTVQVRMTPKNGKESFATCTFQSGNQGLSVWQCSLNFDPGAAALIARAAKL